MAIDFNGVRAKIERAWEHRYALEREVGPDRDGERYPLQLSAKFDPDTGYHIFRVSEVPKEWLLRVSLYVGDIAHNCRSALDQLAWQLVINHTGRPTKVQQKVDVEFPIKYRLKALQSTYTFSKVSPSDRTIIERAQPYHSRCNPKLHPLPVIWQLSNRDKHRMFNPMLVGTENVTVEGTSLQGKDVFGGYWEPSGFDRNLKIGTELMRSELPPDVDDEVEVAGYAACKVILPQGHKPIVNGISALISFAEEVVHEFELSYGV